ncbi:class I SAM-dependent methyltransferase [Marinobacteraceae bacterium S3BR75-40.1]
MKTLSRWYEAHVFPHLLEVTDRALREDRHQLLHQATGDVLEIGIGSGNSLPWYGTAVNRLVGLEPSADLLSHCREKLAEQVPPFPVELVQAGAEDLPFPENHFDTVVAFLVFCTIPEPERAARELRRVLKPGGRVLVFEHVRSERPGVARWQTRVDPVWKHLACGCHLDRDTANVFARAGFDTSRLTHWRHPRIPLPLLAPVISGSLT